MKTRRYFMGVMVGLLSGGVLVWQPGTAAQDGHPYGLDITTGAAPGYVSDAACADCHAEISASLPTLGMGRSFYRPAPERVIEDFDAPPYYHAPSDRHYQMSLRDGDYWFTRWRTAPDGTRMDQFEQRVDWIVGSGNHSRVYLYRTASGTMFQLPLAWYTQSGKWAMAPGFEFGDHPGVNRLVRHRCMTCHTAYPEVPEGAGAPGMPDLFPEDLPEGIGCQRCHGPGAAHVTAALDREVLGTGSAAEVRSAVVNPANLPKDRARDICYSCHMQPSVALPATLRPRRGAYDFRPGERLSDHLTQIDIKDGRRATEDRFEINHHPYRLEQSPCFIETGGAFGCTTCHDPHRKPTVEERLATYRAVCLECHQTDNGVPVLARGVHPDIEADADCTACHMPKRRPQDVTEVWMTDHRIQRGGVPPIPPPPLAKIAAEVTGVTVLNPAPDLPDWERTLAQALSILSYTGHSADYAADAVGRVLATTAPADAAPWMAFAEAALTLDAPGLAFRAAKEARDRAPDHPRPVKLMGLARMKMGDLETARLLTELSLDLSAGQADQHLNLALIYLALDEAGAALDQARAALAKNHVLWQAWRLIGEVEIEAGNPEAAVEALEQALSIAPNAPRVRAALIDALRSLGRGAEADRHAVLLARVHDAE